MTGKKRKFISGLSMALCLMMNMVPAYALDTDESWKTSKGTEWWNFRNNEENNGVTNRELASNPKEVALKWAFKMGKGWEASETPPLIVKGYLYTAVDRYLYKVSKEKGKLVAKSDKLAGDVGYAMNPVTYAAAYGKDMIFIPISNGRIQCIDANSMKSLWVSEKVGVERKGRMTYNQTLAPITYKDGCIYTGTWNTEITDGGYVCLDVKDEDPGSPTEEKKAKWIFKPSENGDSPRGFYWAGAYASENYVVFGSDDGSDNTFSDTGSSAFTDTAILYSVNPENGQVIDKIEGLKGDIRTTAVYNKGYIYCATKGGALYKVKINENGKFDHETFSHYHMPGNGMMTAAPVVYNGRIYIGVAGTKGQFNADGGHMFAVLNDDEMLNDGSLAYTVPIPGYPQAAALLSNSTEKEDGMVRLYFTYNAPPGGIYYIEDKQGQTRGQAHELYIPENNMRQYCISTLCCDREGTIYYKNDSCFMMAVAKNRAYLEDIIVKGDDGKSPEWNEDFVTGVLGYKLMAKDNCQYVTLKLKMPPEVKVKIEGKKYTPNMRIPLKGGKTHVKISAIKKIGGKTEKRIYSLNITKKSNNAYLKELKISTSNTYNMGMVDFNPTFDKMTKSYTTAEYKEAGVKKMNIWTEPEDPAAHVSVIPMDNVGNDEDHYLKDDGTVEASNINGKFRFPIYFVKGQRTATVKIVVKSQSGKSKREYRVTLLRSKEAGDEGLNPLVISPRSLVLYMTDEGRSAELTLKFRDGKEPEGKIEWTTSDEKVVTVTSDGRVKAVGIGSARIFASVNGDETSIPAVVKIPVLELSKYTCYLYTCKGSNKYSLKAKLNGKLVKNAKFRVTQGKGFASVNSKGVVVARKPGTSIITVAVKQMKKTCTVIVRKPKIKINRKRITLRPGEKFPLKIKAIPTGRINYKVENASIVRLSPELKIIGKKKGKTFIEFRCNGAKKRVAIRVSD